jgi:hypothetical protein
LPTGCWLTNERSPDVESFQRWLASVDKAFRANQLFANNGATSFKNRFREFRKTNQGSEAVYLRLRIESTLIPDAIRKCMAKERSRCRRCSGCVRRKFTRPPSCFASFTNGPTSYGKKPMIFLIASGQPLAETVHKRSLASTNEPQRAQASN